MAYIEKEPWEKKRTAAADPVERKWQEQQSNEAGKAYADDKQARKAAGRVQQVEQWREHAAQQEKDRAWKDTVNRRHKAVSYDAWQKDRSLAPLREMWDGDYLAYLTRKLPLRTKDLENEVTGFLNSREWANPEKLKSLADRLETEQTKVGTELLDHQRGGLDWSIDPDGVDARGNRLLSEQDALQALHDIVTARIEPAKSVAWENEIRDQILDAGGEELLEMVRKELVMEEEERQFATYEYAQQHAAAGDWLRENSPVIRQLAGNHYDDWRIYAQRLANAEAYDAVQASTAESAEGFAGGVVSSAYSVVPSMLRGVGAADIAMQKLQRWATGSNVPLDYKTMWQYPGMKVDTIRDTVGGNIAEATEDWIGGDTPRGNIYKTVYDRGMGALDELAAASLYRIGIPGGKFLHELSQGHKAYMDNLEQGQFGTEAQWDAIWAAAKDDLYADLGYAAAEAMTPDERSERIARKAVEILSELI